MAERLLPPDVVQWERMATAVARGPEQLFDAFHSLADGIAIFTIDGVLLHQNPALRERIAASRGSALLDTLAGCVSALRGSADRRSAGSEPGACIVSTPEHVGEQLEVRSCMIPCTDSRRVPLVLVTVIHRIGDAGNRASGRRTLEQLTAREREVAELLAERRSNAETARALGLSTHTASHHTQRVLKKLGVAGRRDVASAIGATP